MVSLPSHLPDLCLDNIFKRITLCDLLRSVRLVCTNWHRVLQHEFRGRRKVVLFRRQNDVERLQKANPFTSDLLRHVRREDGSYLEAHSPLEHILFNALPIYGSLANWRVALLIATLPSIADLTVALYVIPDDRTLISILKQLVRLITRYGNRLVSLKLDFYYPATRIRDKVLVSHISALFDSINQVESLRHLTWNVDWPCFEFAFTTRLPILAQLNTFTSNVFDTSLMTSIHEFTTGPVRLFCHLQMSLEEIVELNPQLASKFTVATISDVLDVDEYDDLRLVGNRFSCISRLNLYINSMPMTMMARALSPLNELIELHLTFNCTLPSEEAPQPELVPVPSVRALELNTNSKSHLFSERLYLAQLFPNLQVLDFYQEIESCAQCEFVEDEIADMNGPNFGPEQLHRLSQCIRLAREPFRRCGNLHTIHLDGNLYSLLARMLITDGDDEW